MNTERFIEQAREIVRNKEQADLKLKEEKLKSIASIVPKDAEKLKLEIRNEKWRLDPKYKFDEEEDIIRNLNRRK